MWVTPISEDGSITQATLSAPSQIQMQCNATHKAREGHCTPASVLVKELRHGQETQDNTAHPKKALRYNTLDEESRNPHKLKECLQGKKPKQTKPHNNACLFSNHCDYRSDEQDLPRLRVSRKSHDIVA